MPSITLTIDGDANEAVSAVNDTAQALSSLPGAAQAADSGMQNVGKTGLVVNQAFRGLKGEAVQAGNLLESFGASASGAGGVLGQLGSAAQSAGSNLQAVATAAMAGSVFGPWGTLIGAAVGGLQALAGSAGAATPALTAVQQAAADSGAAMELAAKDGQMIFTGVPGQAGIARDAIYATVAGLLQYGGASGAAAQGSSGFGSSAEEVAGALMDVVGASDAAAGGYANVTNASQALAASQATLAGRLMATGNGLSVVADMAANAGMSLQQMSQNYGTQNVTEAPAWTPAFRASGGPVAMGRAYVVGEEGPELFVPSSSGQIVPSGGGEGSATMTSGGGGNTYVFNIGNVYGISDLDSHIKNVINDAARNQGGDVRGFLRRY